MKKIGLSIGFIALIFLLLLGYIFFIDDPQNLYNAINTAKFLPMLAGVIMMLLYWVFETLAQYIIIKKGDGKKLRFSSILRVTMIGQLFNCITPSASGGQPMQTYQLTKYGLSAGEGACVLLVRFLVYQSVMVLYSLIVLIVKLPYFNRNINAFSSLAIIGFLVNSGALAALIAACFFPHFCAKAANAIIKFLGKIKILKNPDDKINKINAEIDKFHANFQYYRMNFKVMLWPAVFSALQLTCFFLVPVFICKSLSVNISFGDAFGAAALTFMICSFVPLPGGSGGAEGGFLLLFGSAFAASGKSIAVAILLWRLLTFYMPIVVGSCFIFKDKHEVKNYMKTGGAE